MLCCYILYLEDNNNKEKIENIFNLIYTTKQQPYVEQMGSSVMCFGKPIKLEHVKNEMEFK
jgi:hypothetical protein